MENKMCVFPCLQSKAPTISLLLPPPSIGSAHSRGQS